MTHEGILAKNTSWDMLPGMCREGPLPHDTQEDNINSLETRRKRGPCWTSTLKSRQTRAAAAAAVVMLVVAAAILRGGSGGEGEEGGGGRHHNLHLYIYRQATSWLSKERPLGIMHWWSLSAHHRWVTIYILFITVKIFTSITNVT